MRHVLRIHPECACKAVTAVVADVTRAPGGELVVRYIASGAIADVLLPAPAMPARTDELWRHTCFEMFLQARDGYYEFNFAPSGLWAAYRFDDYRAGMRPARGTPRIAVQAGDAELAVEVVLERPEDAIGPFGISAVIEETAGRLSYWALRHPHGKPDFHSPDGFSARLM